MIEIDYNLTSNILDEADSALSLKTLLTEVKNTIFENYIQRVCVIAEVGDMKIHRGHCFLQLVEYDADENRVASISAKLWSNNAFRVLNNFKEVTKNQLTKGMQILLIAKLEFHEIYGLALNVLDIDPAYTLGVMVNKVKKILQNLERQKIITKNKELELDKDFYNIAVISPKNAAGLEDFLIEANVLLDANICNFKYYNACFQGRTAAKEIELKLKEIELDNTEVEFDVLVIIRGGGSAADLDYLNELKLAESICNFPIPVLVGIGHEKDKTVLDEVAKISFSTPSKVIAFIRSHIVETTRKIENYWQEIVYAGNLNCRKITDSLDYSYKSIIMTIKNELVAWEDKINSQKQNLPILLQQKSYTINIKLNKIKSEIAVTLEKNIQKHSYSLKLLIEQILSYNPEKVLKKGFVLVNDINNKILTRAKGIKKGQLLDVNFYDKSILVKVENND